MELNLSEPGQSRYLRVYEYYKELIVSGQMKPGAKLPSIRKCSLQLQLSRTTVETAYMLLAADGYIISRPQSGCKPGGNRARCAASGGTPGNPV